MSDFEDAMWAVVIVGGTMFVLLFGMFFWEVCHRAGGACT